TGGGRLDQLLAALPAEGRALRVEGAAVAAGAGGARRAELQHPLDLGQLGVDLLQLRRLPAEHVEAEVIADRHLVGDPAQVPLQLGELPREPLTALSQVLAHSIAVPLLPPPGTLLSSGGASPGVAISSGRLALRSAFSSGVPSCRACRAWSSATGALPVSTLLPLAPPPLPPFDLAGLALAPASPPSSSAASFAPPASPPPTITGAGA